MTSIAIIDYGMGNLHSAAKAVERVAGKTKVIVTDDVAKIAKADRVIFPGVGAIRDCMAAMRAQGADQAVRDAVASGKPVLGICVGMQALMRHSEENGGIDCLGLLPGDVKFFGDDLHVNGEHLKVPHMGWNQVHQTGKHPMWAGIEQDARFYFVHSYYVQLDEAALVAGQTDYSVKFAAAATRNNVFAVQFHPEKSASAGLKLLENFANWKP
ncbi:MAG: imidazole glycerol phosphate synthase subunit HisH [Gammaproteobacteria bacterium]|nr:imidazole glycerol phosphate synthase subunit HisH [Gammaproteobacteria bacterium]